MHGISSRRVANAVLAAGRSWPRRRTSCTDLAASESEAPMTREQTALRGRLQAEEVEARRQYEEAVHRFRFLSNPPLPSARAAN